MIFYWPVTASVLFQLKCVYIHALHVHVTLISPPSPQIGANAGIVGMTKEHLGLALALAVPVFVVVTKIDMCPPNVLQETMKLLSRILKSPGCRKIPVTVQTQEDVITTATNFTSARYSTLLAVLMEIYGYL